LPLVSRSARRAATKAAMIDKKHYVLDRETKGLPGRKKNDEQTKTQISDSTE
jgi:hypothetical protein